MAVLFWCLLAMTAWSAQVRNVILCIGDGMGPRHIQAARTFLGAPLSFEGWAATATVTTLSANSGITDSAAAATAMATGQKVNNGVISRRIPGDGTPLRTMLELFKMQKKTVALVTTSFLTDATPAAFGAHAGKRNQGQDIVCDYFTQSRPDILMGGGGRGCTVAEAQAGGYTVVTTRQALLDLKWDTGMHVAALFGDGPVPFIYAHNAVLPQLTVMTERAMKWIGNSPSGFFLMVEAGRIDHASHQGDIKNMIGELLEFNRSVALIDAWASTRSDTLVIVTADHETGGLELIAEKGVGQLPAVQWTTTHHTGRNVGLWAKGPGSEAFKGVLDNTDIFKLIIAASRDGVFKDIAGIEDVSPAR